MTLTMTRAFMASCFLAVLERLAAELLTLAIDCLVYSTEWRQDDSLKQLFSCCIKQSSGRIIHSTM